GGGLDDAYLGVVLLGRSGRRESNPHGPQGPPASEPGAYAVISPHPVGKCHRPRVQAAAHFRSPLRCAHLRRHAASVARRAVTDSAAEPPHRVPRAKSAISCGVAVSKPTTSSMPGSAGSAIEKPFETIPTTTNRASIPEARRYSCRAWTG